VSNFSTAESRWLDVSRIPTLGEICASIRVLPKANPRNYVVGYNDVIENAGPSQISFVEGPNALEMLYKTNAGYVVAPEGMEALDLRAKCIILKSKHPKADFWKIISKFFS
jgi:UDP-3-O-[3-hydroxymyristoyl] glucosamine N-acyltransferase